MAIQIKFKILDIHPEIKSATVYYYTDELVTQIRPSRLARIDNLKLADPTISDEVAASVAEREYPGGSILNVTFFDAIPTGQELVDYIAKQAPVDWLELKTKLIVEPADMDEMATLKNKEFAVPTVIAPELMQVQPMLVVSRTAMPELIIPQTDL